MIIFFHYLLNYSKLAFGTINSTRKNERAFLLSR